MMSLTSILLKEKQNVHVYLHVLHENYYDELEVLFFS